VEVGDGSREVMPFESIDITTFFMFDGLSNFAYYKEADRRHRRRLVIARQCMKRIDRVVRCSTPEFCLGKLHLLKAERDSLVRRRHKSAVRNYTIAIAMAHSNNRLMDEAVAHEQYGRFLESIGKTTASLTQLRKACSLYQQWNGFKKVELLQAEINLKSMDASSRTLY